MSDFKFTLNSKGVRELLQSKAMQAVLKEKADAAVDRLGEGYVADTYVGKTRANAMVSAETYQAKAENSRSNSILKAVR